MLIITTLLLRPLARLAWQFTVLTASAGLRWEDAKVKAVFDRIDRDGSGRVDREEWEQILGPGCLQELHELRKKLRE